VKAAYADSGPVLKRWRARARGRVARIRKRTCHITVLLAELPHDVPAVEEPPAAPAAEGAPEPEPSRSSGTKKTAAASKKKAASTRPAKKKETAN
jgi:large subunit ribosomal protein L22